ncbi:MAG: UPF0182 family membrane protein [Georgenia sp.]
MTTASVPRPPGQRTGGQRRGALLPTIIVLAVLAAIVMALAQVWTEVQWFQQLGFTQVLITEWGWRAALFVVGFLIMGGAVLLNLYLAYSRRLIYPPTTPEERNLDRYRESIEPLRRLVMIGGPIVLGLFAGASLSSQWRPVLTWLNAEPFGRVDPQFQIDIGFFVFTLPVVRSLVSFLMTVVFMSIAAALITHYLYGGISLAPRQQRVSPPARVHLSILATIFVLLIALSYWLDRYSLMVGENERFAGASYADINANLPAKAILAGIAVVVAILFIVTAFKGTWRLPAAGIVLMILSAIVVGSVYPAIVQRFQVEPNAVEAESKFIQRNIDSTLAAYDLEDIQVETYSATTEVAAGQLREDSQSTASIRLLDPNIVSPTFNQLQQNRQYYAFPQNLSVDRYQIEGEKRDTVIAVRELNQNGLGQNQRTWVNDHTVYTHGFGVAAAYGNTVRGDGRPAFFEQGIPSTGELGEYEPRVYFGQEENAQYSIVGAPEGTAPWELDYPDDAAPNGQVNTTYTGAGGPSIGTLWNKLLYALKFGDMQILFSDRVTEESQILFDRAPHDRVAKVAPYLTLDNRAYPAVVDMDGDPATPKDLVWIVDAYTTTNDYPYSARESLEDAVTDSIVGPNGLPAAVGVAPAEVNYIRNSVKAVVNAYDGAVTLYEWDEQDPILDTWQNVFPDQITPVSEISGDLMSHLRYPEDLFKVQRELLKNYHVTDAASFYSGSNFWNVPDDPTLEGVPQPPFYLTMQMPDQDQAQFSLTSSFIPGGQTERNILTGFLAVDSETGDVAGEVREGYGRMRLLELPSDVTVPGPGQVQNNFNANPTISTELNLLRQGGSEVRLGNLLTLPVGGGLLYVQPVYVQASSGTQYPLLQHVLVSFGDTIGFAPTLDAALDQVFGGDSGAQAGDAGVVPAEPGTDPGATPDVPAAAQERLTQALADAQQALTDGNAALAAGDFAAYGKAQDRLSAAISAAIAAEDEIAAAAGTDPATVTPGATATDGATETPTGEATS